MEGEHANGEEWSSPRIPENVVFDPDWELKRGTKVVVGGFPVGAPGQERRDDRPTLAPARVTTGPLGTRVPEGLVYLSLPNLEETQGDSGGVLSVWDDERKLWVVIGYLSQARRWTLIGHPVLVAARFPPEVIDQLDTPEAGREAP